MPTTQVGSHTVYYEEQGQGHPLLLVAGLGASRLSWRKQVEPLAKHFRVIVFDNRDVGDSAKGTGPYQIVHMAADTAGLIKHLGIAPTYLMGWSMGGFISLELTLHHPEMVEKLILVATSMGGPPHTNPAPEIAAMLVRQDGEDIETRVRRNYALISGPGFMDAHPEEMEEIIAQAKAKPISLESYQRQLSACLMHNASDRLAKIAVPTLVVHGDYDPLVPYANGQYLTQHIPGARLSTYANVGHLPPIEATERFNREVAEFLR